MDSPLIKISCFSLDWHNIVRVTHEVFGPLVEVPWEGPNSANFLLSQIVFIPERAFKVISLALSTLVPKTGLGLGAGAETKSATFSQGYFF